MSKTDQSVCMVLCEEGTVTLPEETLAEIQKFSEIAAGNEELPAWESCIVLTNDTTVHQLNKDYRNIDSSTDVLSFPENDLNMPLAEMLKSGFEPELTEDGLRIALGDIYISVEQAARQAEEYGNTLTEELCFLAVHGMLHLMGYDHMVEEDEIQMRKKQRRALGRPEEEE